MDSNVRELIAKWRENAYELTLSAESSEVARMARKILHKCADELEAAQPCPTTSVGSTSEQYREQGWENLVVNGRIDSTKNWGIAVADKPASYKGNEE